MANIYWKMTRKTYHSYLEILEELDQTHPEFEVEKFETLVDHLKTLPDFPSDYHPDHDVVVPVVEEPAPMIQLAIPKWN